MQAKDDHAGKVVCPQCHKVSKPDIERRDGPALTLCFSEDGMIRKPVQTFLAEVDGVLPHLSKRATSGALRWRSTCIA